MSSETYDFIVVDDYAGATVTTTDISDGTLCEVMAIRNRGIPSAVWGFSGLPSKDGGILSNVKLEPREIQLDLLWTTTSLTNAVTRREALYELFKPFDTKWLSDTPTNETGCWLQITRADSSVRRIKCQVTGTMDLPYISSDPFNDDAYAGKFRVNLLCPDPAWFDPTAVTLNEGGLTGTFSSSFSPGFGSANWFMYPIITLIGPATTFTISQSNSDSAFSVASPGITGSETITFDTRPFVKTIKDQTGALRYDLINNFYDFTPFLIAPTWMSSSGLISFNGTGGSAATDLTVEYNKTYIGV